MTAPHEYRQHSNATEYCIVVNFLRVLISKLNDIPVLNLTLK
jgi:hypothetical protein